MSLARLVFYSALIGGWAAFAGWLLCEITFLHRSDDVGLLATLLTAGIVGALIAGGLNLLGGVASGSFLGQIHRLWPGLLGGFVGGAVGGLLGALISFNAILRALGWMLMGIGIGVIEGWYDKSPKKIRNGIIGGSIGGFLGGLLFAPIYTIVGGNMSSRATAFVILGLFIGLFIGLAQVLLKEAWLTVEEGFRPGRQFVINIPAVIMGTSEKSHLPFIAVGAKGVEPIHLQIYRHESGAFVVQDNNSRTGTFVNGYRVEGAVFLRDGDVIQLGVNKVRFREVTKHVTSEAPQVAMATAGAAPAQAVLTPAVPVVAVMQGQPPKSPAQPPKPQAKPSPSPHVKAGPAPAVRTPSKPPTPPVAPTSKPAAPAVPVQAKPAPAASAAPAANAASKGCPVCGRVGPQMPNSSKRRCESCGIFYT